MRTDFVGRGWSFPLDVDTGGRIAMAGGAAKLEQAMRIVLGTHPGERPFRPEFGCPLRDYVFSGAGADVLAAIAGEVRRSLRRWEPRVVPADIQVFPHPDDESVLLIDIAYVVKGENDPRNLVFPFYTIPENGSD
ncbi:GPW/gp25 family protein [Amycolatopsis sp., V23-08]|uniref:GPW/gp25 family protein n=1 Tax=Amycolatopsis heterodermiae TaxID=3110235 RepID=A0ABU5RH82_9PSEU|nr:GPW/gp25 family protein [Amycolatopsis sp., V23-08]MEA5365210.1 GPW/gp25 family protein [Amycolatopsis sp., V23-08]